MKGALAWCLSELVRGRYGVEAWQDLCHEVGIDSKKTFIVTATVEDDLLLSMFAACPALLGLTRHQFLDAFADYWIHEYAAKTYGAFFKESRCARDFFSNLNRMHESMTRSLPGATPPRFEIHGSDTGPITLTYLSRRGLVDLVVAMAKKVGEHYGERLEVRKLGPTRVKIDFLD